MMKKNARTKKTSLDLLKEQDFKNYLHFETNYAIALKGGYLPEYFSPFVKRRLISPVNILTAIEINSFINQLPIYKN